MLRQRIEARTRNIAGMPEITWARLLQRRDEYEPWTDPRLVLDTSRITRAVAGASTELRALGKK